MTAGLGSKRRCLSGLVLLLMLAPFSRAVGDPSDSPLLWQMPDGVSAAPHLSTEVEFEVSGIIARVRLTQRFRNDEAEWVEGIYTFPLPDGAAVDELRMRYGQTLIVGEIQERQQAKNTYTAARNAGQRAVLVDRQRPNLFTTRLANVGPGETVEIEIAWQQSVGYEDGEFSLRLPMTLTPRYSPGRLEMRTDSKTSDGSPVSVEPPDASQITPPMITRARGSSDHRFALRGVIDAGVELRDVVSRYHPVRVTPLGRVYRVELAASEALMDQDVELNWRALDGTMPAVSLFRGDGPTGDETLLLLFHPPHPDSLLDEIPPPRELIFVIDTSGSMHGNSIAQAREALALALSRLRPVDRFNVIEFNSSVRRFLPAPVPAESANRAAASRWINALKANGGTEMRPALDAALGGAAPDGLLRQIVFITDGSVGNEEALLGMIREGLGDSRLFTVAIGSAPNTWFMRKAAEVGRGSHVVVSSGQEVAERMERLFRKLERPALTDLTIDWPSGLDADAYPRRIADLYYGEPVIVTARLEHWPAPDTLITVSGRRGAGYWSRQLLPGDAGRYPGVAKLWARARVEALEDARRAGADEEQSRAEILQTALSHHLVTAWTSLVAVDHSRIRPAHAPLGERRVANLLPHGQSGQAIFGLPASGTSAPLRRLTGLLCLLAGLALLAGLRMQELRRYAAG